MMKVSTCHIMRNDSSLKKRCDTTAITAASSCRYSTSEKRQSDGRFCHIAMQIHICNSSCTCHDSQHHTGNGSTATPNAHSHLHCDKEQSRTMHSQQTRQTIIPCHHLPQQKLKLVWLSRWMTEQSRFRHQRHLILWLPVVSTDATF